ncbi:MAG: hypothetical protein IT478_10815 [Xanthomonadales bacterium]|nr:hypothetical protein [Xanthomonadales bacterium]
MRVTTILLAISCPLLATSAVAEAATRNASPSPRFALRAQFEAEPPAQTNPRFQLRATLQAAPPSKPLAGDGRTLRAVLRPKTAGICYPPGHIFADGFETSP